MEWHEIPGWLPPIVLAALWGLLEFRLQKAGYLKKPDLDGATTRIDKALEDAAKEQHATQHQVTMIRTDLDAVRDRCTRFEANQDPLRASLERMEMKLDTYLEQSGEHAKILERHAEQIKTLFKEPRR